MAKDKIPLEEPWPLEDAVVEATDGPDPELVVLKLVGVVVAELVCPLLEFDPPLLFPPVDCEEFGYRAVGAITFDFGFKISDEVDFELICTREGADSNEVITEVLDVDDKLVWEDDDNEVCEGEVIPPWEGDFCLGEC